MWTHHFSKCYPNISPEQIWRLWSDVNNWPAWHDDLVFCELKGPFETGSEFMLKPKSGPKATLTLIEVQPTNIFTDCTSFLGAKMFDTHRLERHQSGLIIHNTIVVTGPLKALWVKLVAQKIANSIERKTDKLIELASKERQCHECITL